jgi:hypothetical protein
MTADDLRALEERARPARLTDRVAVPLWVVLLAAFVVVPVAGFALETKWLEASSASARADRCLERAAERDRQDKIARWRARCEEIASSPEAPAAIGPDRRAFIEICMSNAAKEEYK